MTFIAVAIGGLIGTALRLGIDALLPHVDDGFPWSTLIINLVGSFLLGVAVRRFWPVAPTWLRAGLGAGVLGSFTTFSAVMVSVFTLTRVGDGWMAATYLIVSIVAGLAAAALGLRVGGIGSGSTRPAPAIGAEE